MGEQHRQEGLEVGPLDSQPGPARRLSRQDAAALVARAMEAAGPLGRRGSTERPSERTRGRSVWAMVAGATVLFLLMGGVSAALYRHVWWPGDAEGEGRIGVETGHKLPLSSGPTTAPSATASPQAAVEDAPHPEAVTRAPSLAPVDPPSPGAGPKVHRASAMAAAERRAGDLLARANRHRRQRQWGEADRWYAEVRRAHPRSTAALVALLASASLHLEHLGDVKGALALYQEAAQQAKTSGGDALAHEALAGMAEAYGRLGEKSHEARLWRSLLQADPQGSWAERARRRLRLLEASP